MLLATAEVIVAVLPIPAVVVADTTHCVTVYWRRDAHTCLAGGSEACKVASNVSVGDQQHLQLHLDHGNGAGIAHQVRGSRRRAQLVVRIDSSQLSQDQVASLASATYVWLVSACNHVGNLSGPMLLLVGQTDHSELL